MGTLRILSWLLRGLKSECVNSYIQSPLRTKLKTLESGRSVGATKVGGLFEIDIPMNVQPPTYFGKVLAMKECTYRWRKRAIIG
jgi:hypothetical protein